MHVPSYTVVPESMQPASNVIANFNVPMLAGLGAPSLTLAHPLVQRFLMMHPEVRARLQSLRGLGCDCSETDPDTGDCLDPDPCVTVSTPVTTPTTGGSTMVCPGDPGCPGTPAPSSGQGSSPAIQCADGSYVAPGYSCPATAANPQGLTAAGLTQAQQAALSSQIIKSGTTLATLLAIQPGQAVLPNGTIVSTGTGSGAVNPLASLTSTSSGTMLLFGLVAVGAILLMGKH